MGCLRIDILENNFTRKKVQADFCGKSFFKRVDYYAFGFAMPNRNISSNKSRFGFNGKEKDQDGEFGDLSHYDYGFRIYNPAIGRFLSVDPLAKSYPWYTPYQFAGNKPIMAKDLDGLEEYFAIFHHDHFGKTKLELGFDESLEPLGGELFHFSHEFYNKYNELDAYTSGTDLKSDHPSYFPNINFSGNVLSLDLKFKIQMGSVGFSTTGFGSKSGANLGASRDLIGFDGTLINSNGESDFLSSGFIGSDKFEEHIGGGFLVGFQYSQVKNFQTKEVLSESKTFYNGVFSQTFHSDGSKSTNISANLKAGGLLLGIDAGVNLGYYSPKRNVSQFEEQLVKGLRNSISRDNTNVDIVNPEKIEK